MGFICFLPMQRHPSACFLSFWERYARFLATIRAAAVRDRLGRSVKKSLRAQLYAKLLRLGVRETKTVKPAGLTQLATEGIEQLDLYYSSYLPQFFCATLSLEASR